MRKEKQMKLQKQKTKTTDKIYIIGAGGHGQVVADVLLKMGIIPSGFLDDNISKNKKILDIPVIGKISYAHKLDGKFIIAIGDNKTRKKMAEFLNFSDEKYFTVIHPSAVIGSNVRIGCGTMIMGGAVINTETIIGKHVIINTSSSVDHHNKIGDFVHVAPGTHLGGNVTVKNGVFLGLGTSVIPGVTIGSFSILGAGAVVISDVPDYVLAVGVPAKIIRRLK